MAKEMLEDEGAVDEENDAGPDSGAETVVEIEDLGAARCTAASSRRSPSTTSASGWGTGAESALAHPWTR
eukprot:4353029-Pyramimonas_sp.AAC.1